MQTTWKAVFRDILCDHEPALYVQEILVSFLNEKKNHTKKRFAVNISQTMTKYLIKYNYSETV